MKIRSISLTVFQNEEHYNFLSDVTRLINLLPIGSLPISDEYTALTKSYTDEGEALNFVRKSNYSTQLHLADSKCNETINGLKDAISSGLKHYIPEVKNACGNLDTMWKTVGNITTKSLKNKSGAMRKLIADLKGSYIRDVTTAGLQGWVSQLEIDCAAHDAVENNRYDEKELKTHLRMKEVRKEMDAAYHAVVEKINALILVNGEAPYVDFVNKLNLRIDSYANDLALRNGKKGTDTTHEA